MISKICLLDPGMVTQYVVPDTQEAEVGGLSSGIQANQSNTVPQRKFFILLSCPWGTNENELLLPIEKGMK
jgi:hypothetical protein